MNTRLILPALLVGLLALSGCDAFGDDGVEGVWVEAGLDEGDLGATYLRVTESTLTIYNVYRPLECLDYDGDEYGLTSSDGTVLTFGEGSREYRISQDGDELVVTRSGEPTRYERSGFDADRAEDCFDLVGPMSGGSYVSSDGSEAIRAFGEQVEYLTSYNQSDGCYRSFRYLYIVDVDGLSFTYRDGDGGDEFEFEANESGTRIVSPTGVTLSPGFVERTCG